MSNGKRRLVVVGNGMAGARLVEDVLARGGGDQFAITVFGDEPCGNYNRILLSGVLAGSHRSEDIFLNPLSWYQANGVTLHAGVRVEAIDVAARQVRGAGGVAGARAVIEAYDALVIATGSRPLIPRSMACRPDTGAVQGGGLRLSHAGGLRPHPGARASSHARRGHRRRPARARGGKRPAERRASWPRGPCHPPDAAPDGDAARCHRRPGCCSGSSNRWAWSFVSRRRRPRSSASSG